MILSKPHTKYIQSLQHKKFRDGAAVFIAEGPKVVIELLDSRAFICKEIFALPEWIKDNTDIASRYGVGAVLEVKEFELGKISALQTPNKVLAIFEKRKQNEDIDLSNKLSLLLDTIQDPGNMGTIIRTADWFGIENIICSYGCADIYNPKVVQGTMGSLARVNIIYTDIERYIRDMANVKVFAATMEGRHIDELGKLKEAILVIGNEGKGISDEILALIEERITIPRSGKAESLNAAVAAGIILSHVV